jgi:hypothetical protein
MARVRGAAAVQTPVLGLRAVITTRIRRPARRAAPTLRNTLIDSKELMPTQPNSDAKTLRGGRVG